MKTLFKSFSILTLFFVFNVAAIASFDVPVEVINKSGMYAPLVTFTAPTCSNIVKFDVRSGETKKFTAKDCGGFLTSSVTFIIENAGTEDVIRSKCPSSKCFFIDGGQQISKGSGGNKITFVLTSEYCKKVSDKLYYCKISAE